VGGMPPFFSAIFSLPFCSGLPSAIYSPVSSVSVKDNLLQVKGTADSEMGVAQFVSNLKSDPTVKKVELDSIGSSQQNEALMTFLINVSY